MLRWFNLFIVVGVLCVLVLLYYFRRPDDGENEEEELSLKEQMLAGISPPPQNPETQNPEEEKTTDNSFWARVYSGKNPQSKYMRYIAGHERRRAIEAARLADEKGKKDGIL